MRIAFLADIHSNLPALEAVRADLRQMAPDFVFLGGDQINRCPWPNEVMEMINEEQWPAIYGNHELVVHELASPDRAPVLDDRQRFADLWWTFEHLRPEYLEQIHSLPSERHIEIENVPAILLVHGLRGNPFEGIYPDMRDEQIAAKVEGIEESVLVCAHTHRSLAREVSGKQIFNPGSVGMPYNGDPRAQYMVLDATDGRWQATFRHVDYDHSVIRKAFDELGLFQAYGPLGPLFWQTIATGDPWVSDFQVWVRDQAPVVRCNMERAVALYLRAHGPGNWAFSSL